MTVVFDGTRINDAEDLSVGNWEWTKSTTSGATATLEPDYFYQNANCISGQIKTGEIGFVGFDTVSTWDIETTPQVVLFKIIQTNYTAIDGNGLSLEIGSDTTAGRNNIYYWYIFSAITYPAKGGFQFVPIDANISGYRSGTGGTPPTLSAISSVGIRSDANAQAKAPNVGIDALDYIGYGEGLTCTGTTQTFADFLSFDEGTLTNRYGVLSSIDGILYVVGTLNFGTATAIGFSDSNKTIVFPDGRFGTSFAGLQFDLQNASSTSTITSCSFSGVGEYGHDASTADTRPYLTVTGTSGDTTFDACSFLNFNKFTLTTGAIFTDSVFVNPEDIVQVGATFTTCTFDEPVDDTSSGRLIIATNPSVFTYCSFIQGLAGGHAIQCDTIGTYDWTGNTDTGYTGTRGSNLTSDSGSVDAMFFNDSGGLITLNVGGIGGQSPTVRNGIDASTVVVSTLNIDIHVEDEAGAAIEKAQVCIQKDPPTVYTANSGTVATGALTVNETIDTDLPQSGWLLIWDKSLNKTLPYRYASWAGTTFTLKTEVTFDCTGGGTGILLQDTVNNFLTMETNGDIAEGDTVRNVDDGSWCVVDKITDANNITTSPLQDGTDDTWTSGDTYSFHRLATTLVDTDDIINIPLVNRQTDSSGDITTKSYGGSDQAILIDIRSSSDTTKYQQYTTTSTISTGDFSTSAVLIEDDVAL